MKGYDLKADGLVGTEIFLDEQSVTGTENISDGSGPCEGDHDDPERCL